MENKKDYYEILEISSNASDEVIKMAYKALVKKYHPDINGNKSQEYEKKMKEINEAYEILSNPQKRAQYDYFRNATSNNDTNTNNTNNNTHEEKEKSTTENNQIINTKIEQNSNKENNTISGISVLIFIIVLIICIVCILNLFVNNNSTIEAPISHEQQQTNQNTIKTETEILQQDIQNSSEQSTTPAVPEVDTQQTTTTKTTQSQSSNNQQTTTQNKNTTPAKEEKKYCPGGYNCPGAPICPGARTLICSEATTQICDEAYPCEHGVYGHHNYNKETQQFECEGGKLCPHGKAQAHEVQIRCIHGFATTHEYTEKQCEHGWFASHRIGLCEHGFTYDHRVKCEHGFSEPHYY